MSKRTKRHDIRRRAYSTIRIKKLDDATRIIEGIATSPSPDRLGDVVEPKGAKFSLPMPLLWQHDPNKPVGNVIDAEVTDDGIRFRARIEKIDEPGTLKDRLDEAWQSVKKGLARGVSIGFSSTEPPELLRSGGLRFLSWEWFELSIVTIPANPDAVITTKDIKAASGRICKPSPGVSGQDKDTPSGAEKKTMKTTAEKIRELEDEIDKHKARMAKILEETEEEEREMDEDEEKEFDEEEEEVKALGKKLHRLKAAYGSSDPAPARLTPVREVTSIRKGSDARGGLVVPAQPKAVVEKGLGFARMVMCFARAKGNHQGALEIAKQRYPQEAGIQAILKAQVTGGTTDDPSWAAPLVEPENLISEFVEFLRPMTIIGKFGTNGIPSLRAVPFNIQVPAQVTGGNAEWVGEGKSKPLTRFDFNQLTLRFNKVAAIAVLSEELVRHSRPSAEILVRNALADAVIARLDTDIVDPAITEIPNVRPGSFTAGAQTYVSFGVTADEVREDIGRLATWFIEANIPVTSVVLIMRTAQALKLSLMRNALGVKEFPDITMSGGSLEGFQVITSQYVPQGLVAAVATNEVYLADDGGVAIDMSREASLQMADDPTNTVRNDNSPPQPTPTELVSMFQTNSIALRAERIITWKRRREAAVVYQTGTGWGNPDTSPPQAPI